MENLPEFVESHPILVAAFAAILAMIVYSELGRINRKWKEISPLEASQLLSHDGAIALDVRESNEFQDGHIIDAKHVPLSKVKDQLDTIAKDRETPVVAYCRSGNRSGVACGTLTKEGFSRVYNLRGGVMAWQSENMPLKRP